MTKNYFIAFEGIDGCGKDTQLNLLIDSIREDDNGFFGNKYSNIWITREPTKITNYGIKISNLLKGKKISAKEATEYFIKDRIEHSKLIRKNLDHSHILTSRYDLSTFSYQINQGMNFEELYKLHKYEDSINGSLIPDLTIVFDISIDEAFRRQNKRNSQKEFFEDREFLTNVKNNLEMVITKLKKKDNRNIIMIDANPSIEEVKTKMIYEINKVLK